MLPGWSFDNNYEFSELGKIWVIWYPSVKILVISRSLQMTNCEVQGVDHIEVFVVYFVYTSNDESTRQTLWDAFVSLSLDSRVLDKAWVVLGDFSQVLLPRVSTPRLLG